MQIKQAPISPIERIQQAVDTKQADTLGRYKDAYEIITPSEFSTFQQEGHVFTFFAENKVAMEVSILSSTIFRVRYAPKGKFERDFSYAIDPKFKPQATEVKINESKYGIALSTAALIFIVSKDDLRITIYNHQYKVISSEIAPYCAISTLLHGLSEVRITKYSPKGEAYFGLGDKSSALNLRGQIKQNWNTDAFAFGADRDPLYRSIPFYFGLHQGNGYGIFFDNTYRTHFDFAATETSKTTFFAEGGELNYYFIYGPELLKVAEQYTDLTGKPELPPLWSLGYHQCRWSYFPESRVKKIAQEFRARRIPCDALYLDIDYMDDYRCFTWNNDYFPDPKGLMDDLKEKGFQTIVMIDPGLKVDDDYAPYQEGIVNDYFCKRTTGELMVGPVWPPECVFPDFTNMAVRDWWGKLYREMYIQQGVSGFWNDMNEPAMFKVDILTFPDEVMHYYEGEPTNHRKAHNIYGLQMSRATTEGLKQLQPQKRPFLLTRATFSGGQRYAAVWTGDNVASWEHLHIANIQCQRLSISGFSFCGSDVGGFAGVPTGELMVRWLQLGAFHPFFRVHSIGNNVDGAAEVQKELIAEQEQKRRLDQEPWVFGEEYENLAKAAIEMRYHLLGYTYTAFWQYATKGTPMLKSLSFFDQTDTTALERENEFIFGNHLLIAPITQPCTIAGIIKHEEENQEIAIADHPKNEVVEEIVLLETQEIYLPKGNWYLFQNNQLFEGQQLISLPVSLAQFPIFVKAGAVIAWYPVQQFVGELEITIITLKVFYVKGSEISLFYQDAGEGYQYQKNDYKLTTFTTEGFDHCFSLQQTTKGNFASTQKTYQIEIYGLPFEAESAMLDGKTTDLQKVAENGIIIQSSSDFNYLELR
jgi:alpha-glucosidase